MHSVISASTLALSLSEPVDDSHPRSTCRGPRDIPCPNRWTPQTKVLTQRRPPVVLLIEAPLLQLRDHVGDEIRIGTGHMGRGHDEAVAAAAYEHVLHRVGDLLWTADDGALDLSAAAVGDEVARARVGLAAALEHDVANAEHALHPVQLVGRECFVDALGHKIEIERLSQER